MNRLCNYRVLPIFLLLLVIGILTASFLHYAYAIAITIVAAIMVVICFNSKKMRKYTSKAIMVTAALLIAITTTYIGLAVAADSSAYPSSNAVISGRVSGVSAYNEQGQVNDDYFYLDLVTISEESGDKKLSGYVKIYLAGSNLKLGDRVTLRGNITPITNDLTNQEYISYYRDRIYNLFTASEIVGVASGEPSFFDGIKLSVKKLYYGNSLGKVGGFMYAMMFGDSSGLDPVMRAESGSIGVAHLFAVSGLHVGMIALVLVFFMDKLRLKAWLQALITIVVLAIYNLLCGFSSSVLRASIMIVVTHVARIIGFKNDSISTLSFAGISVLAFSPFALFDISFIMSFVAVLAIVLFNKPIKAKLIFLPNYLASIIAMTISVNIGLLPIMIMCFGNISLIFTLANMLIIPIVTFGYPIMFVSTLIALGLPFLSIIIKPISSLFVAVEWIISMISALPFASVGFNITVGILVAFIIIMVLISRYIFIPKLIKRSLASMLVIMFSIGVVISSVSVANPNQQVTLRYVDKYTSEAYYHIKGGGKDYLVLNGDVSIEGLQQTLESSNNKLVDGYDGLIMDTIDNDDELAVIDKYYALLGCEALYIRGTNSQLTATLARGYKSHLESKRMRIKYGLSGEIIIEFQDSRLLFYNNAEPLVASALKYTVIFPTYGVEAVQWLNYDYIVSKYVDESIIHKKIPFTFTLNSGKLLA